MTVSLKHVKLFMTAAIILTLSLLTGGVTQAQEGMPGQSVDETAPPGEVDSTRPPEGELTPDPMRHVDEPEVSATAETAAVEPQAAFVSNDYSFAANAAEPPVF